MKAASPAPAPVSKRQNHVPKSRPHQQSHESVCGKSYSCCCSYKGNNCPPVSPAVNCAHLVGTQLKKRGVPQNVPSPPVASGEGMRTSENGREGVGARCPFLPSVIPEGVSLWSPSQAESLVRGQRPQGLWEQKSGAQPLCSLHTTLHVRTFLKLALGLEL